MSRRARYIRIGVIAAGGALLVAGGIALTVLSFGALAPVAAPAIAATVATTAAAVGLAVTGATIGAALAGGVTALIVGGVALGIALPLEMKAARSERRVKAQFDKLRSATAVEAKDGAEVEKDNQSGEQLGQEPRNADKLSPQSNAAAAEKAERRLAQLQSALERGGAHRVLRAYFNAVKALGEVGPEQGESLQQAIDQAEQRFPNEIKQSRELIRRVTSLEGYFSDNPQSHDNLDRYLQNYHDLNQAVTELKQIFKDPSSENEVTLESIGLGGVQHQINGIVASKGVRDVQTTSLMIEMLQEEFANKDLSGLEVSKIEYPPDALPRFADTTQHEENFVDAKQFLGAVKSHLENIEQHYFTNMAAEREGQIYKQIGTIMKGHTMLKKLYTDCKKKYFNDSLSATQKQIDLLLHSEDVDGDLAKILDSCQSMKQEVPGKGLKKLHQLRQVEKLITSANKNAYRVLVLQALDSGAEDRDAAVSKAEQFYQDHNLSGVRSQSVSRAKEQLKQFVGQHSEALHEANPGGAERAATEAVDLPSPASSKDGSNPKRKSLAADPELSWEVEVEPEVRRIKH